RRSRARGAGPRRLAKAGMGSPGADLSRRARTRAHQPFAKPLSQGMILFWSSVAASLLAAIGCAYLITAAILVRRFARHCTGAAPAVASAVTILKPLHGDEPGLLDNLRSFCIQDYGGDIQIVFGVQDPGDGAIAIVERLRKLKLDCDLDLVVDTQAHGLNRKVSNLANMAPRIRHDVVVLADSDIRVDRGYLPPATPPSHQPPILPPP